MLAVAGQAKAESADSFFAWNESYAGVFAGAGRAFNRIVDIDGFADWGNPGSAHDYGRTGAVVGALAGLKFAVGGVRLRLEADATVGSPSAGTPHLDPTCPDEAATSRFRWVAAVRLGIEEDIGGVGFFASAGPALARVVNSVTDTDFSGSTCLERDLRFDADDSFRRSATKIGWALGAGIETPLAARWTVRLDGSYFDFGRARYRVNRSGNNPCGPGGARAACTYSVRNRLGLVRLAIVYRFGE